MRSKYSPFKWRHHYVNQQTCTTNGSTYVLKKISIQSSKCGSASDWKWTSHTLFTWKLLISSVNMLLTFMLYTWQLATCGTLINSNPISICWKKSKLPLLYLEHDMTIGEANKGVSGRVPPTPSTTIWTNIPAHYYLKVGQFYYLKVRQLYFLKRTPFSFSLKSWKLFNTT